MDDEELVRDAAVLARHYWQERGMTQHSPDTCACGARTHPVASDEEATIRRARAFAVHQAEMLAEARSRKRALASGRVTPGRCYCGRRITTMSDCQCHCVEHDGHPNRQESRS